MTTIPIQDALGALASSLAKTTAPERGSILPLILANGTCVGIDLANVLGVNKRGDANNPLDFNAIAGNGFYTASTTDAMVNYPPGIVQNEVFMVLQIQDTVGQSYPRAIQIGFSQRQPGFYFRCAGGSSNTLNWTNVPWNKVTAAAVTG